MPRVPSVRPLFAKSEERKVRMSVCRQSREIVFFTSICYLRNIFEAIFAHAQCTLHYSTKCHFYFIDETQNKQNLIAIVLTIDVLMAQRCSRIRDIIQDSRLKANKSIRHREFC